MDARRILLAGIGADCHNVALTLICRALRAQGHEVDFLGIQVEPATLAARAPAAEIVMLSSLDGHAGIYLEAFPGGVLGLRRPGQLWMIGGNLGIGADPAELERRFGELGFDTVVATHRTLDEVCALVAEANARLPARRGAGSPARAPAATRAQRHRPRRERFETARRKVLASWPTGEQARDLDANFARQAALGARFSRVLGAAQADGELLVHPRCGVERVAQQRELFRGLAGAGVRVASLQIDSLTRSNRHREIERALGRNAPAANGRLNGYPLVNLGRAAVESLVDAVPNVPVQVRHGTRDPRLLAELALAGGCTAFEGGLLSYTLPYFRHQPLEQSLEHWRYVDGLCAGYARAGFEIDREFFGTLTATLVPPSLAIVVNVVESLLAAEQGCRHFSVGYAEQGSRAQDIAAIRCLERMVRGELAAAGHDAVQVTSVFHQYMAGFPTDRARARQLIGASATTARLSGATRVMVKTCAEASGIPRLDDNLEAIELVTAGSRDAALIEADEAAIAREEALIEREAAAILSAVRQLCNGGGLGMAVIEAVRRGLIDIPFSPHSDNSGAVVTARDGSGAIRFLDAGRLPFDEPLRQEHAELLQLCEADRDPLAVTRRVERDVVLIPEGRYDRWPLDS